jgi:hypothetical protein
MAKDCIEISRVPCRDPFPRELLHVKRGHHKPEGRTQEVLTVTTRDRSTNLPGSIRLAEE